MIGLLLDQALKWVRESVSDTLDLVWKLLVSTLFHLPDVTVLAPVQEVSTRALLVVNIGYGLVIAGTGVVLMLGSGQQVRHEAGELLPLLALGLLAANFATRICTMIITSANALVLALTSDGIASPTALGRVISLTTSAMGNPVAALLVTVIGLTIVVLLAMLTAGWITRFVVLILLCGIAPLALAAHATPWTAGAARLWWRSMGGVCLTVILQALTLNTSLSIFLNPTDLSRFGLPPDPDGLLELFIVAVLLWITVRIPALVRQHLTQTGGRANLFGTLIRLVIAQQVTRGLARGVQTATAAAFTGRRPGAVHSGLGRHVSGGARGRAGSPGRGVGRLDLGPVEPSRGSHGGFARHAGGGARGEGGTGKRGRGWIDPGPLEYSHGAHSRTGRHIAGPRRQRGGFANWPAPPPRG